MGIWNNTTGAHCVLPGCAHRAALAGIWSANKAMRCRCDTCHKRLPAPHRVGAADVAEALRQQAKESLVGTLLGAALDDHGDQLDLLPRLHPDLHQLVPRLLKVHRGHDGEVDGAPQVHQVGLRLVLDDLLLLLLGGSLLAVFVVVLLLIVTWGGGKSIVS